MTTSLLLLSLTLALPSAPQDAVVRVQSSGGSGTVIWTSGPTQGSPTGKSYVLSAAHMFESAKSRERVTVHAPSPNPAGPQAGNSRCVAVDHGSDLALVLMQVGPLPYCCPVAPTGHRTGNRLLSVGYDNLKWPSQQRPTRLLSGQTRTHTTALWEKESGSSEPLVRSVCTVDGGVDLSPVVTTARGVGGVGPDAFQLTQELPWHGRSGGALIDLDSGVLIGVVSGYRGASPRTWAEVKPGACGVYASHKAVLEFLSRHAPEALTQPAPRQQAPLPYQEYLPQGIQAPAPPLGGRQGGRPWVLEQREGPGGFNPQQGPPSQPWMPPGMPQDHGGQRIQQPLQRGAPGVLGIPAPAPGCSPGGT